MAGNLSHIYTLGGQRLQWYRHMRTHIYTNPRNTGRLRRKMMRPLLCRLTMNEIDYILRAVFIYRKFSLLIQSLSFKNTAVQWKHLPCDHLGLSRAEVREMRVSSLPWNLSIGMEHNRCLSPQSWAIHHWGLCNASCNHRWHSEVGHK